MPLSVILSMPYFNLDWQNPGFSWTSGQQVQARLFYNDDPPSVPRNVRGRAGDENHITLNWDAPSSWGDGTAGGFELQWKPTKGTFLLISGLQ